MNVAPYLNRLKRNRSVPTALSSYRARHKIASLSDAIGRLMPIGLFTETAPRDARLGRTSDKNERVTAMDVRSGPTGLPSCVRLPSRSRNLLTPALRWACSVDVTAHATRAVLFAKASVAAAFTEPSLKPRKASLRASTWLHSVHSALRALRIRANALKRLVSEPQVRGVAASDGDQFEAPQLHQFD